MINLLPNYLKKSTLVQNMYNAITTKLNDAETDISDIYKQLNVYTATWALNIYEKELGIVTDTEKDIDERREQISSRWRSKGICTADRIKAVALAYDNGEVDVTLNNSTITVKYNGFYGLPSNQSDLESTIQKIIPCHLALEFLQQYLLLDEITSLTLNELQTKTLIQFAPVMEG